MEEVLIPPDLGLSTEIECQQAADLVRWIAKKIRKMGGAILIGPERDNLCRRATALEMMEMGGHEWVIEAQGLPNLIHEVVHALFLGRLDDDHGFEYGEIPLDMGDCAHRAHLWEELACCALSTTTCAPLRTESAHFTRDWFAEQFEIQGVFHGLEHDLDAFRAHIARLLEIPERIAELEATVAEGHDLLADALREVGADYELPPCDAMVLWQEYLVQVAGA
jgi:hypothetical protein